MLTHLRNLRVIDPTQTVPDQLTDLWISGDRLVSRSEVGEKKVDVEIDLDGHFAMAGGIDLHTHIGGGKVNIARMLLPELLEPQALDPRCARRDPLLKIDSRGFLPAAPLVGKRYLEMGYTACFEPAMIPSGARMTHAELADTPGIDTGAYVVLGNDDCLLEMIRRGVPQEWINAYVGMMVDATQALGVKVVNAGGIHAFKFNGRSLDVDEPHPRNGVTPASIIRCLARAVDEIGLPQPLHVHASNLGMAGNIESTLKTIQAADGRRIHLTHVQFHSYGAQGPQGFSSGAEFIAKAIEKYSNLTVDVGQVMFGQTVTVSADTMHQFSSRNLAKPRKSIILDIECEAGCGVVPFRYQNRRYVNALQWAIGLELFMMIDDPSRVFLTTDHPNGGPFTTYPHLLALLMDRDLRSAALREIHADAAAASQLQGLEREYSLSDVAIMTRAAPANFLGLVDHGHLRSGAIADIAIYRQQGDWEKTWANPAMVFRRGRIVVRDGVMIDDAEKVTHRFSPKIDSGILKEVRAGFEQFGAVNWDGLRIEEEEMADSIGSRTDFVGARQ